MWRRAATVREDASFMDTSDTPWCWYYLAECGRWHSFEDDPGYPLTSGDIEQHYQRDPQGLIQLPRLCTTIDFSAMLQTDHGTRRQRRLQRGAFNREKRCCCFSSVPVFWENTDPSLPYQLIPLSNVSPEYNTVMDHTRDKGLLDKTFMSIYRIQNLDLWELYCRKKIQLMRIQEGREILESRLFHGTKKSNVHNICMYNFDFRLAGCNGHRYGKGTYFAKYAAYANKYSESSSEPLPVHSGAPQRQNSKIVFLARVLIGRFNLGQLEFVKPDHGTSGNAHDSCVDDVCNPNVFVIFDPNQIYPEYLIEYC